MLSLDRGSTLRASFELVAESIPEALCDADARARLRALSSALPPVHRAGFECRLHGDDPQVDLQQCVIPTAWELRTLRAHAAARAECASEARRDAWSRVVGLCDAWSDSASTVSRALAELWLEFDVLDEPDVQLDERLVPSIFGVLRPERRDAGTIRALAEELLTSESADRCAEVMCDWEALLGALAPNASLSHLGVMLGRQPAGVRVHVSGLPLAALGAFLEGTGWEGPTATAVDASRSLLDYADQVVFCFDLAVSDSGVRLAPRLGLEAFFEQKSGVDPRWRSLLDALIARDLAHAARVGGLLSWSGVTTPLNARTPWPTDLLIRSMVAPAHHLGVFERRLSHLKLMVDPRGTSAKAYFGYGHLWIDPLASSRSAPSVHASVAPTSPISTVAPGIRPANTSRSSWAAQVKRASARAEEFLLGARNQGGWWRDFFDVARSPRRGERVVGFASDEWVSAYVACALVQGDSIAAREAASDAWELLAHRRAHARNAEGWGYHGQLPPDADSTAWALRLAATLGAPASKRRTEAERFIASLTAPNGAVATYRMADASTLAEFLRMPGAYDGWCAPHGCVTAAVAKLQLNGAHLDHVRRSQLPDGHWVGHWWDDDEYPTLLAADALAIEAATVRDVADRLRLASSWAASRVSKEGSVRSAALREASPFATSLAIATMASFGDHAMERDLRRAAEWLCDVQRDDGSFPASALLRVPAPWVIDPMADPASTVVYLDNLRIFTTATAYDALRRLLARLAA